MGKSGKFKVGDWVEVRSKEEILRTLDSKGQLDGMPFMPEMFQYCGQKFPVYKSGHKSCDPDLFSRRIENAVHVQTRCDGAAHGGCQAGCLLTWKDAWLKPSDPAKASASALVKLDSAGSNGNHAAVSGCTEADVRANVMTPESNKTDPVYVCQTTQVPHAGKLLKWWDVRQYIEDYTSGNISLWQLFKGFVYSNYHNLSNAGIGVGPAMRWFYNLASPLWRGSKWPRKKGAIPLGAPTPALELNLKPGELVRVKSHEDILKTVNVDSKNRGMHWDAELVPYCGGTYQVLRSVTKVIDEKSGKMVTMKTPAIVLDSVICQARYSPCRMFCPKSTWAYWREIWLERVSPQSSPGQSGTAEVGMVDSELRNASTRS